MKRILVFLIFGIILAACSTNAPQERTERSIAPRDVIGKTWQWVSTLTPKEKITVASPERYTIVLLPEGKAKIKFDCNNGQGDYNITDGRLSFGPLISTRMACPPDTQDAPFMRDLQRVDSFFLESGFLYLELRMDSGTMRLRLQP